MNRALRAVSLTLATLIGLAPAVVAQERRDLTGWFNLRDRLGSAFPTGADITVLQVEGWAPGYLPFIGQGTGEFSGKINIDHTGLAQTSSHAGTVGRRWYGNTQGYAPGIVTIESYNADHFLTLVLQWTRRIAASEWPAFIARLDPGDARIINNSWILGSPSESERRALVRSDFQTEFYGLIYINAVNNGAASAIPPGFTSSFNSIVVGRSDGNSSAGPTTVQGARAKPDLVAPDTATSWTAPQVGGAAAMLLEQAMNMGSPEAELPRVIKAIMQAGAEKLAGWEKGDPGAGDDPVHPLDWRQGAGELQVDRNYDIMDSGMFAANSPNRVRRRGWSYETVGFNEVNDYLVAIVTTDTQLNVSLAWHRHHTGNFFVDPIHPLNNITLEVWETDAGGQPTMLLQESRSLLDNVQHIHLTGLVPANYLIRLTGLTDNPPGPEDYGLAWWSDGGFVPGDMNGDGALNGGDIDPFFLALGDPAAFVLQFPGIDPDIWGDFNGDQRLNGGDIDPFFACLGGGPCP